LQVGTHGLIIEFTDPNNNVRRSATYLPEVAAHEGKFIVYCMLVNLIELVFFVIGSKQLNPIGERVLEDGGA